MNIGVDAGALSVSDDRLKVGVYRVIVNFLRVMAEIDLKNNYRLYSFDPIDQKLMGVFGSQMENRVIWPVKGWASVRLPLELSLHPVDIFLGVSQMIPRNAGKAVGFLYDVGFVHRPQSYPGSFAKLVKQTKDLLARSNAIVTISETVKKDIMHQFGFPEKKIIVAYPGADGRFIPKGTVYRHDRPYFLFVGAMKPGKNVPALISAFAEFTKKSSVGFDLLLVGGDYWNDPEIDIAISRVHLSDRIHRLGHVSDDELPKLFRGATAFVSPSFYEGFCLPAIEAMACGCPVIGSTEGAMKEIVGDAGILLDPQDGKSLTRAMEKMAYNAKLRDSYAQKSIINAKRFTWNAFGESVYKVMESLA